MNCPVEVPLLLEAPATHAPTSAPEFEPDHFEAQLPASTFAPPPVDTAALDYDTVMAELDRLQLIVDDLKLAAGIVNFTESIP